MGQVVSSHAQEDMRVAQHVLKRTTDDLVAELLDATELYVSGPVCTVKSSLTQRQLCA